jgi:hypothetical protein
MNVQCVEMKLSTSGRTIGKLITDASGVIRNGAMIKLQSPFARAFNYPDTRGTWYRFVLHRWRGIKQYGSYIKDKNTNEIYNGNWNGR